MKSGTRNLFGAGARNWRVTSSFGQGHPGPGRVVLRTSPRTAPRIPGFFASRAPCEPGELETFAPQLQPGRPGAAEAEVLIPNPPMSGSRAASRRDRRLPWTDRGPWPHCHGMWTGRSAGPCRSASAVGPGLMAPRWRSPVRTTIGIDEGDHRFSGRPDSARAKYADAFRRGIDPPDQFLILLDQDLVRLPKLPDVSFQLADPGPLLADRAAPHAAIRFRMGNIAALGCPAAADLGRDGPDG